MAEQSTGARANPSTRAACRIGFPAPAPPDANDGNVEIAGGIVVVREPGAGGRWPVLVPGDGVEVLVNGQPITGPIAVSADEDVLVRRADQEPFAPRHYAVAVSDDRSEVRVELGRGAVEIWEVPDHPQAQVLTVSARRKTVPLPAPAWGRLLGELGALNLAVPGDEEGLRQALDTPEPAEFVVARGQPPVQPEPGQISPQISPETTSVQPGTLLAVRTEPVPGSSGRDVFGQTTDPGDVQSPKLLASPGASLIRAGTHCVATIQGRPDFSADAEGNVTVRVLPCLVIAEDVTIHNAPPEYAGDVIVQGWVRETALLTATGKIDIAGGVEAAEIRAGGGVTIQGGCIRIVVRQGRPAALFRRVMPLLTEVCELLEALQEAQAQLAGHPGLHGPSADSGVSVLRQLVETARFARLYPVREELRQVSMALPPWYRGGLTTVHELLQRLLNREDSTGPPALESVLAAATRVAESELKALSSLPRLTRTVSIYYAPHSEIHAEGDVSLFGPGAEHTVISAAGSVEVTGNFETGTRVQHFTDGERYVTNGGNPEGPNKRSRTRKGSPGN